jgi:hypothetical protein
MEDTVLARPTRRRKMLKAMTGARGGAGNFPDDQ